MDIPAGRFAPSPTGPLHLGSLTTALASWLDARSRANRWLVRLDDLDQDRNRPGADTAILAALEAHGLAWDGPVQRQSEHRDRYRGALEALMTAGRVFYCRCSRRVLAGLPRYPGHCRGRKQPEPDATVRILAAGKPVTFTDLRVGTCSARLDLTIGDFVIWRRDDLPAYALATAVDDGDPAITRVIRGRDLLDQTPAQIWLMGLLGAEVPEYAHLPLVNNRAGQKLSKQTMAPPLDLGATAGNLRFCLGVLGLHPPAAAATPSDLLAWALPHWSIEGLPTGDAVL